MITPSDIGERLQETTSTGTAFAFTKDDAIYTGLKECVERNALLHWFYRTGQAQAQVVANPHLTAVARTMVKTLQDLDYELTFFLIQTYELPTLFIAARNQTQSCFGSASEGFPVAAEKALYEVITMHFFSQTLRHLTPKSAAEITTLPQHMLFYQSSDNYNELLTHLFNCCKSQVTIQMTFPSLAQLKNILHTVGVSVYTRDLTAPEIRPHHGYVIRTIIPEFLDLPKHHTLTWRAHESLKNIRLPTLPTPFA
jgi:ribosomal protein S12 methylthiotransferase accessory factor YcaO